MPSSCFRVVVSATHPAIATRSALFLLAFALSAAPSGAAVFAVGSGTDCTHATLEAAFAAAAANAEADQIRMGPGAPSSLSAELEVENDTIELIAGLSSCAVSPPTGFSTLSPNAAGLDAFWVHGTAPTQLTVRNLHVVVGPAGRRALRLEGRGSALFYNSSLEDGQAPEGGNVWMDGPEAVLELHRTNVKLGTTTLGNGGGIYCSGGGQILVDDVSFISENSAFASGGGLYLDACGFDFTAGDWGLSTLAVGIHYNQALHGDGGGIAAKNANLELRQSHIGTNLVIGWNEAPEGAGGGIHLNGTQATATLRNATIQENVAGGAGGGVLATAGAQFSMNIDTSGGCGAGWTCSTLWFNRSTGSGFGGLGVSAGGAASLKRTSIYGNYNVGSFGGAALGAVGAGSSLLVESSLLYGNDPNGSPGTETSRIFAGSSSSVTIAFSTILEATDAPGVGVIEVAGATSTKLVASIVQPWFGLSVTTFAPADPPATVADCLIVRESASLPPTATAFAVITDPTTIFQPFTSATEFPLRNPSPAIDFCDTLNYSPTTTDIGGATRGFDEPVEPDFLGPFDLGAHEWRLEVFADGFESGGMARWGHS